MLLKVRILLIAVAIMAAVLVVFGLAAELPDPQRGLVAGSTSPAEMLASLKRLTPEERVNLGERERHVLVRNPLDAEAIFNLAVIAELDGDTAARDALITEGTKRSRRNPQIQLAALQLVVGSKDFDRSVEILDGLMRSRPELNEQVMPIAAAVVAEGHGLDAFAKLVAQDPPWRHKLLLQLVASDPSGGQAYRYLAGLAKRDVAPHDLELAALLSPIVQKRDYTKAYFIWLDMLSERELQKAGTIFDGEFTLPSRGLYFDWTLRSAKNARVDVKLRDGSAIDRALVISMLDNRQRFGGAIQYLRLAPGGYLFSAEALVKDARTSGGLVWRIKCLEQPALLGQSPVFAADQPWSGFELSFTVPDTSCDTQTLQLESLNAVGPDLVMSGQLSFDNFKIIERP